MDQGKVRRDLTGGTGNNDSTDEGTTWHNVFEPIEIQSESDFVAYCEGWFLSSQEDISDAFISQGDLVDFLAETCFAFEEEYLPEFACPYPTFTSIAVDVQVVFVRPLCDAAAGEEMVECLKSLVNVGEVFGFGGDLTTSPFAEELCCGLLAFVERVGLEKDAGK